VSFKIKKFQLIIKRLYLPLIRKNFVSFNMMKGFLKKIICVLMLINSSFASNYDAVKQALIKEYKAHFSKIIIKDVKIEANGVPKDFESFNFLRIANLRFERASGYLRAEFSTNKGQKNIFFRYFIKADLEVLRANKELKRGDRLSALDYSVILMSFDKVPLKALSTDDDLSLVAKSNVARNAILRQSMFKKIELVKKGDFLRGVLKDKDVQIFIELSALESGNKGDIIRLKTKEGKLMQGLVVDKNLVELK